jgi:hypothetical protein
VESDLSNCGVVKKRDVCFTAVKGLEYAYVINDLNYSTNLRIIDDYFAQIGIDRVVRFTEFKYLNIYE